MNQSKFRPSKWCINIMQSNLRSILVRTTSCQVHPATCTRLWKAFFGIAWVLYQLGSLHNARKSTSAMSNFEKKDPKNLLLPPKKTIPQNHKSKSKFKPLSINSFIQQAKKITANTWLNLQKIWSVLKSFFLILINCPQSAFFILLTTIKVSFTRMFE